MSHLTSPMAPPNSMRLERERRLKALLAFVSTLSHRLDAAHDATLAGDLQTHIRELPFQASSTFIAKHDELDRLGTELWNLSTRLRRDGAHAKTKPAEDPMQYNRTLSLLRVLAFLLLDSAGNQTSKGCDRKSCIRLMRVALKAARMCIASAELSNATKVLESAADYQDVLSYEPGEEKTDELALGDRLRVEYFLLRTMLAWRQNRMDTAEHMFSKSKQLAWANTPATAETCADLLYEIGRDFLGKRSYDMAVTWLERAHDVLSEHEIETLSAEAGELRLSIMQSTVQAYMKSNDAEAQVKAWHMIKLLESDYGDKMVVSLLKLELLYGAEGIDSNQVYTILLRMIKSIVLNEKNFKTIMHHIHKIKAHCNATACKVLDDLIELRLFKDENQAWIEKAVITRIWIATMSPVENALEAMQELVDRISRNTRDIFSAPATHAAQILLWKRVEAAYSQEQYATAEAWCLICLHPVFEKAGQQNKSKIARKLMICALARQDYVAVREAYSKMSDFGRDEPQTRYLMYKAALHDGESALAAECLNVVCQNSSKDATHLQGCVIEALNIGNRQQTIIALEKMLERYDHVMPAEVHLPALLRFTARLLHQELIKDGALHQEILGQLCVVFEGACKHAKASRRRPSTPAQQLFDAGEFEWFAKNTYNLSLKYCAEMLPTILVRLLNTCIEFVKLLQEHQNAENSTDITLRLMFCHFLAACTFVALARAEDNIQSCLQHYLEAHKHCQEFRRVAAEALGKLSESSRVDVIAKHYQIVKLELEALLKLEKWDELDSLFDECWKHESPDHYQTLADLVLVIHSCVVKADIDGKYQSKTLSVLQKIINLTWRETSNDVVKLSRWIRCLFQLAISYDESISLGCMDHASRVAATRMEGKNRYPPLELEWLVTTSFNHAIDYYLQDDDTKCKVWAEKALNLAQWAGDDSQLRDVLLAKYSGLTWQQD